MATAREVIVKAFGTARVLAEGDALDAAAAKTGLELLNSMFAGWPLDGISYQHEELESLDSEVVAPAAFDRAIRYLLAVEIAEEFGSEISQRAVAIAERERSNLQAATNEAPRVKIDLPLRRMFADRRYTRSGLITK